MSFSLDKGKLSLFVDFHKRSSAEKQAVRTQVLHHLDEQGENLESYFTELISRKKYREFELVMPLFWMETDERLRLAIAHKILSSDYTEPNEDFIHFVQKMKRPESVPFIEKSIQIRSSRPPYVGLSMYYDQCGYALRDIGTPEAFALIDKLTKSDDPILAAGMKLFVSNNLDGPDFEYPEGLWW